MLHPPGVQKNVGTSMMSSMSCRRGHLERPQRVSSRRNPAQPAVARVSPPSTPAGDTAKPAALNGLNGASPLSPLSKGAAGSTAAAPSPATLATPATAAGEAPLLPPGSLEGHSAEQHDAPGNSSAGGAAAATAAAGAAAGEAPAEEEVVGEPYSLAKRVPLAGGVLELVWLEGSRMLRVWLPPGYDRAGAGRRPYPLLLLNDGQNLFDDRLSFSGCSWRAAEAAAGLIASGRLPPFVVAGIDHAGANRSWEYLPYPPGTGPGGFRGDAAAWPGGGVAAYMDRVLGEVLPWLAQAYGTATDPAQVAFGGSSFGGICALWACMHRAGAFGAVLVESPSLWFAEERFLNEDIARYEGPWPHRVFLAMGSREYSGIRQKAGPVWDELLIGECEQLAAVLQAKGLGAKRLMWEIDEGATHTESAWAARLPRALPFLLQPWWGPLAAHHTESLFFTSPRRLQAGQPAVLFVNKPCSQVLAGHRGTLQVHLGFNLWRLGVSQLDLAPAPWVEGVAPGSWGEDKWQAVAFQVPREAYEMQFVLTDGQGNWDSNGGCDYYLRVKAADPDPAQAADQSEEALLAIARQQVESGQVDEAAARAGGRLFFTWPETLLAGAPAVLYFNRARSEALAHSPNVQVHMGFSDWEVGAQDTQLMPTSLWRGQGVDWWATQPFEVPEQAFDLSFAFTDGHGAWESNDGHNYTVPVAQLQQHEEASPRGIASVEEVDHAGGKLHIVTLTKRACSGKAGRDAKWKEEKVLRVWTPPGFSKGGAPPGGWPVLYMQDGQNMFEDWLAHQGVAWNVGHTAAGLISSGKVPPFVVVAVDSAGPMRSLNYLPYKPGTGAGGFRGDCERWPGGGCEGYMRRLVQELMPLVQDAFGTATDPARVAFGGGSFAGVAALYAALHYPHVFGSVLAESPSLWIAEGRFLNDMWSHKGQLPERLFMGCGTREYSATRDHERPEVDALLLHYYHEAARALEAAGMRGGRLAFQVEEGAGHHESAWQWRLTGALEFLLSPWWDV